MDGKGKKRLKLIIIISALVFVCFCVFLNINNIIKAASPETYLKLALFNTGKSIYVSSVKSLTPNEQKLSAAINETGGSLAESEYSDSLDSLKLDLITKTDIYSRKMDMTLSVVSDGFEMEDNRLYISPGVIAVKAPYFYSGHEYVTVDPGAFKDDFITIIYNLAGSAVFGRSGKTETTVNKQPAVLEKMFYTVPAEAADEAYHGLINLIKKQSGGDFLQSLDNISVKDDLTVNFYINEKHRVVKLEIGEFQVANNEGVTASFSFYLDLFGDKNPLDGISLALNAKSGRDDYTLAFSGKSGESQNVLSNSSEMSFKSGGIIMARLLWDTEFDTENNDGNNLNTNITLSVGFKKATANIAGSRTDAEIEYVETPDLSDSIDFSDMFDSFEVR